MKTKMILVVPFFGALLLAQADVRAADANRSGDEQQIKKIEQDWIGAIVKRDAAYMAKLEADDYMMTGPDGKLLGKQEDIKNMTAGDTTFDDLKTDVFIKQNGQWKAVAAHVTPVAPEKK